MLLCFAGSFGVEWMFWYHSASSVDLRIHARPLTTTCLCWKVSSLASWEVLFSFSSHSSSCTGVIESFKRMSHRVVYSLQYGIRMVLDPLHSPQFKSVNHQSSFQKCHRAVTTISSTGCMIMALGVHFLGKVAKGLTVWLLVVWSQTSLFSFIFSFGTSIICWHAIDYCLQSKGNSNVSGTDLYEHNEILHLRKI